jgi:hypothetical protein
VNKGETLSRLERLLERVRTRARARGGAVAAPAVGAAGSAELIEEPVQLSTWTPPPPELPVPDVAIAIDVDYVEAAKVTLADRRVEDATAERFDSTARLVVAHGEAADEVGEELIPEPEPGDDIESPAHAMHLAADAVGEETAEPAPASSRRPVMGEPDDRLERMAFGAEEAPPPLHTPPPESGRVPAAPADDFDPDVPDTREAARPDERLVAEATRVLLESGVPVAKLSGTPRRSLPATFSALLDETLSL